MNKKNAVETGTQSTTQRAYVALREAIITGEIAPGEKLKVENLKSSLNTGASPVREALSLLTSNQLVERRDQRGFRVAAVSRKQFDEILRSYELFEQHHRTFHMALVAACDSPILLRFCEQLYDLNIRYRYLAVKSDDYANRNVAGEHQAILDAAIDRNVELACKELVSHYQNTGEYLAQLMELS